MDLETLKEHPSLKGVDWKPVEEWAAHGHALQKNKKLLCDELRKRISLNMWNALAKCKAFMTIPLRQGQGYHYCKFKRSHKAGQTAWPL